MSTEPTRGRDATLREVRAAARAQTRRLPTAMLVGASVVIAILLVAVVVVMDYMFQQQAHRLWKVVVGLAFLSSLFIVPRFGFFVFPIATPFLSWLPKIPVPGMNPLNIMLFGVFGAWAWPRLAARRAIFRRGHLSGILLVLFVVCVVGIVRAVAVPTGYGYNTGGAIIDLIRSFMTFAVYFVGLSMVSGEKDRRRMAWAIVIGLLLESIVTIMYGRNGRGARAIGSIGQSNELGTFLALYAVLATAMLFAVRNAFGKAVLVATTVLAVIAEVYTVSRAGFVAIGAGLFFVTLRSSKLFTIVLVAVAVASPVWMPDYLQQRILGTTVESSESDEVMLENSAQVRIYTWQALTKVITEHPLDGVGFSGLYYVLPQTGEELNLDVMDSSHNSYLRFLAELGIGGLIVFIVLLWKCLTLAMKGMRLARSPFDRQLALALAAGAFVLAWSCAFGDRLYSILVTGNFWLLCALVDDAVQEAEGRAGIDGAPAAPPERGGA